jgi:hypothetical protein
MSQSEPGTSTLERGNIYFVYTPRVHSLGEEATVEGLEDIERTYMILSVDGPAPIPPDCCRQEANAGCAA